MANDYKYIAVRDTATQAASLSNIKKEDIDIKARVASQADVDYINTKFKKLGDPSFNVVKLFPWDGRYFPAIQGEYGDAFIAESTNARLRAFDKNETKQTTNYSLSLLATKNKFIKAGFVTAGGTGLTSTYEAGLEGYTQDEGYGPIQKDAPFTLGTQSYYIGAGNTTCIGPWTKDFSSVTIISKSWSFNPDTISKNLVTHGIWKAFIDEACGKDVGSSYTDNYLSITDNDIHDGSFNDAATFFNKITKQSDSFTSEVSKVLLHHNGTSEVDTMLGMYSAIKPVDTNKYGVFAPLGFLDTVALNKHAGTSNFTDVASVGPLVGMMLSNEPISADLGTIISARTADPTKAANVAPMYSSLHNYTDCLHTYKVNFDTVPLSQAIRASNAETVKSYSKMVSDGAQSLKISTTNTNAYWPFSSSTAKNLSFTPGSFTETDVDQKTTDTCIHTTGPSVPVHNFITGNGSFAYYVPYGYIYIKFSTNGISGVGVATHESPINYNFDSFSESDIQVPIKIGIASYKQTETDDSNKYQVVGSGVMKSTSATERIQVRGALNEACKCIANILCTCASSANWYEYATTGLAAGYHYAIRYKNSNFQYNKAETPEAALRSALEAAGVNGGYAGGSYTNWTSVPEAYSINGKITEIRSDASYSSDDYGLASSANSNINWVYEDGVLHYKGSGSKTVNYKYSGDGSNVSTNISYSMDDSSIEESYPSTTTTQDISAFKTFVQDTLYGDLTDAGFLNWPSSMDSDVNSVTSIIAYLATLTRYVDISTKAREGARGTKYGCSDDFVLRLALPCYDETLATKTAEWAASWSLVHDHTSKLDNFELFNDLVPRYENRWLEGKVATTTYDRTLISPVMRKNWQAVETTNRKEQTNDRQVGYAFNTSREGDNITTKFFEAKASGHSVVTTTIPGMEMLETLQTSKIVSDTDFTPEIYTGDPYSGGYTSYRLPLIKIENTSRVPSVTTQADAYTYTCWKGIGMLDQALTVKCEASFSSESKEYDYTGAAPYKEVILDSKMGE